MREVVQWFGEQMEEELAGNDHKTGWDGMSFGWLSRRLGQEFRELKRRLPHGHGLTVEQANEIISEAADVANFAMMIADNARQERDAGES